MAHLEHRDGLNDGMVICFQSEGWCLVSKSETTNWKQALSAFRAGYLQAQKQICAWREQRREHSQLKNYLNRSSIQPLQNLSAVRIYI